MRRWAARHGRGTPAAIGATVKAARAHGLARVGHTAAVVLVLIGLALVGGAFLWR
jgi:hypothetical protein